MNESNRRRLTLACTGAVAVLMPLSILVPLLNPLMALGMAAIYYLWFSKRQVWLLTAVVFGILLVYYGGSAGHAAYFVVALIGPGILVALTRRLGAGLSTALVVASAIPVLACLLYSAPLNFLLTTYPEQIRSFVDSMQLNQVYSAAEYQRVVEWFDKMADAAPYYVPGTLLSMLALVCTLGALIGEWLVRNAGVYTFRIPPFSLWRMQEWMVIPVGISVILTLVPERVLNLVGWNALVILFLVLSVFGASFLEYHMRARGLPLGVRVLIYIVLVLTQIVAAVVLPLIALFDAKFDFRKIRAKQIG